MSYWKVVARNDYRARCIADRHYSRQKPGTIEFCPPGNNIVLLGLDDNALWVSHRPDPKANLAKPRQDGMDYYDNPYFRNESRHRASDMIREALAITRFIWNDYYPVAGFHSFVDPRYITPTKVRRETVYGYCFLKAGFYAYPERTKARLLWRWIMPLCSFLDIQPIKPVYEYQNLPLFAPPPE
jgi:hypothetical protein